MNVAPSTTSTSSDFVKARYASTTVTSIVVAVSATVTLFYLARLHLAARRWAQPREYPSVRLQRSTSFAWMLLVLAGIAEISISAWTIAQYDYDFNNRTLKLRLSLWCGIWMALIPGSYSFLSLNPKFSETPLEWGFYRFLWACAMVPPWIVVLVLLGILLPCDTVSLAYCRQLKALFGISLAQCVLSVLAVFVVPKIRYE